MEGSIIDFCKENKISHHQLYYRRKRLKNETKSIFHAIPLNKKEPIKHISAATPAQEVKNVKIQIGKANIYIPVNETQLLSDVIKELAKSC